MPGLPDVVVARVFPAPDFGGNVMRGSTPPISLVNTLEINRVPVINAIMTAVVIRGSLCRKSITRVPPVAFSFPSSLPALLSEKLPPPTHRFRGDLCSPRLRGAPLPFVNSRVPSAPCPDKRGTQRSRFRSAASLRLHLAR